MADASGVYEERWVAFAHGEPIWYDEWFKASCEALNACLRP